MNPETPLHNEISPSDKSLEDKASYETINRLLDQASEALSVVELEEQELIATSDSDEEQEKIRSIGSEFRKKVQRYAFVLLTAFAQGPAQEAPDPSDSFAEKEEAKTLLLENGITTHQQAKYIPGVSELLARSIRPYAYGEGFSALKVRALDAIPNMLFNKNEDIGVGPEHPQYEQRSHMRQQRLDAWNLYLGIPQENETFGISDFQPASSQEDKYYFKINGFFNDFSQSFYVTPSSEGSSTKKTIKSMLDLIDKENTDEQETSRVIVDQGSGVMGQFKLSKGQDENGHYVSYYDKWDLEGRGETIGKPFEIYDRLYYNPVTFEIIDPNNDGT